MPLDLPDSTHADAARARRRRITIGVGVVAAALIACTGIAFARSSDDSSYRTAVVAAHPVDQTLTGVATIEPVSQATVAFPSSGTVATVAVHPGDQVTTGAELASLDPTSLQQAVDTAQANLAQAQLTLERAENGQSTNATGGTGGSGTATTGSAQPTSYRSDGSDATTQVEFMAATPSNTLTAAQQAVTDGQKQVDADLAAADQALAAAGSTCNGVTDGGSSTPPASSTSSDSSDRSSSSSSSSSTDPTTGNVGACYSALAAVLSAQQQSQTAQKSLAQVATALDALLAQQTSSPGQSTAPSSGKAPSASGGAQSQSNSGATTTQSGSRATGSQSSSGTTAVTNTPSSADLIADQKAVDAANDEVAAAQQAALDATIVSPIDGTVVAVNLTPGSTVSANSSTANVVIAGPGGYEAVTMVKVTDLPNLKVGQAASVTPDGLGRTITGQVIAVGLVSTTGTTGTTYPVTIGLTGSTDGLHDAATATTVITTSSSGNALAVPTSAVHADNGHYSVDVLHGDSVDAVTVQVGPIGATWTAITSGLSAGDTVVLANVGQPLPSSATSSTNGQQTNRFTGTGGRTGGGTFGPPN